MPQFDCFITCADREYLLGELASLNRFTFYISAYRPDSFPICFQAVNSDILKEINIFPSLLLFSSDYDMFGPQTYNPPGKWGKVEARIGGPSIELLLLNERVVDDRTALGRCEVAHYASYKNPITGDYFDATAELHKTYALVLRIIKKYVLRMYCSVKLYKNGKIVDTIIPFWLSRSAINDIAEGKVGVLLQKDGWKTSHDFVKNKDEIKLV